MINLLHDPSVRITDRVPPQGRSHPVRIGIIGGGLSGAMVAVHLLRQATTPLAIYLIHPNAELSRGLAYSTPLDCHVLNVPAGRMSLFPEEPHHFLDWLQRHAPDHAHPHEFVPRWLFGEYAQSVLREAQAQSPSAHLIPVTDHAIAVHRQPHHQPVADLTSAVHRQPHHLTIECASTPPIPVDRLILAIGNLPPRNPTLADERFYTSDRYVRSVWSTPWLERLSTHDPVVIIGSGLTAVDQVMRLQTHGHRGPIHLVSRRGLLPQAHGEQSTGTAHLPPLHGSNVRSLMGAIRREVEQAVAAGKDWRSVMDALRPQTQTLWRSLPLKEQERFLRHVRPYWEVHRHRIAPAIAHTLTQLLHSGQLQIHAGRILGIEEDRNGATVTLRQHGTQTQMQVRSHLVLNCTGSECDYRRASYPLIQHLLATGLACPDPLHLGLAVTEDGAVIDRHGTISEQIYTLGSPQKGLLWETTAVPEIRVQSRQLATRIVGCVATHPTGQLP